MLQIGLSLSLLLSFLLAGTVTPEISRLLAFARNGVDPVIAMAEDDAPKKLIERFGFPLKVEKRSGPDGREPGVIREAETWYYDGLVIALWGDYGSIKRWITQTTLTSPEYKLQFGLAIGSPKKAFIDKLGPPSAYHSTSELFKYVGLGTNYDVWTDVDIYFNKAGRATKIVWTATIP